jgi:hypothetical protein
VRDRALASDPRCLAGWHGPCFLALASAGNKQNPLVKNEALEKLTMT